MNGGRPQIAACWFRDEFLEASAMRMNARLSVGQRSCGQRTLNLRRPLCALCSASSTNKNWPDATRRRVYVNSLAANENIKRKTPDLHDWVILRRNERRMLIFIFRTALSGRDISNRRYRATEINKLTPAVQARERICPHLHNTDRWKRRHSSPRNVANLDALEIIEMALFVCLQTAPTAQNNINLFALSFWHTEWPLVNMSPWVDP